MIHLIHKTTVEAARLRSILRSATGCMPLGKQMWFIFHRTVKIAKIHVKDLADGRHSTMDKHLL